MVQDKSIHRLEVNTATCTGSKYQHNEITWQKNRNVASGNFSGRMTETVRLAVSQILSPTFQVSLSLRAYYGILGQFHWGRDILNCPL